MKNLTEGAPVQFLMLMRTDEKLPDCVPAPKGGPMSQPTNGKILYDGKGIFAIEYTLGAGNLAASLPNAPFLLYGLSDGTLSVSQGPGGGKARRTMNGFADWMDGCATRLNNAGDKPVRFAVMGFWAE